MANIPWKEPSFPSFDEMQEIEKILPGFTDRMTTCYEERKKHNQKIEEEMAKNFSRLATDRILDGWRNRIMEIIFLAAGVLFLCEKQPYVGYAMLVLFLLSCGPEIITRWMVTIRKLRKNS